MPGKKLLVADDSLTIQKVIRLALSNEGYEIQAISDGADCIQQISTFRPHAVLIDVSLPTRSAFEIKREVNGLEDHATVKFILMSSAFEKIDEAQATEVGFDGHLTKPFDPAHLRQVLTEVLAAPPKPPKPDQLTMDSSEPMTSTGIHLDLPLDFPTTDFEISETAQALPEFSPPPPPPIQSTMEISDEEELWGKHEEFTPPPTNPVVSSSASPSQSPSHSQDDIRQLTESTIRMSGLADMPPLAETHGDSDWTVNEPSLKPPGSLSDLGGSSFQLAPADQPPPTSRADLQSPMPPQSSMPPMPSMSKQSPELQESPEFNEEVRRQVHETLQVMVEKMARQILPEVAERLIKAEINRLLNEKL